MSSTEMTKWTPEAGIQEAHKERLVTVSDVSGSLCEVGRGSNH